MIRCGCLFDSLQSFNEFELFRRDRRVRFWKLMFNFIFYSSEIAVFIVNLFNNQMECLSKLTQVIH